VENSIGAVKPSVLFEKGFHLCGDGLDAFGKEFDLSRCRKIKCVAIGKSAESMANEVERKLGGRVTGIIATPIQKHFDLKRFLFFKTGHPFPDKVSTDAAREIYSLVSSCGREDLLIFLISGGGSAAAFLPVNGVSLSEVNKTLKILLDSGVPIDKINLLRRHLSLLGGGKLAALSPESEKISLIISDVVGDDLPSIASGPTVEDLTTPSDAYHFLRESGLTNKVPKSIAKTLIELSRKVSKINLKRDFIRIIASNLDALNAAERAGVEEGYNTLVTTRFLDLNTESTADLLVSIARSIEFDGRQVPALMLLGGETTVKVTGTGKGGRNQQLVLETLRRLAELTAKGIFLGRTTFFSFGTDGKDGNSSSAGAYVSAEVLKNVKGGLEEIKLHISRNDSHSFFKKYGGLIMTGPTDTNVMDIMGIIVE
jgi:glycerate-2-kinase